MTTTTRRRVLRGGVALVIGLQILVPAIALTRNAPTRFGFQMYSGLGEPPRLTTIDTAGREQRVTVASIAASARPEIRWSDYAPHYLCRARPALVGVRVELSGRTWTVPC